MPPVSLIALMRGFGADLALRAVEGQRAGDRLQDADLDGSALRAQIGRHRHRAGGQGRTAEQNLAARQTVLAGVFVIAVSPSDCGLSVGLDCHDAFLVIRLLVIRLPSAAGAAPWPSGARRRASVRTISMRSA